MSKSESDPITLSREILASQGDEATGDFTILMASIQLACKVIGTMVRKAGILGHLGAEGSINVQGEDQKKLDILSHDVFVKALISSTKACVLVSEEVDAPIFVPEELSGKYCVTFDPLDGSSNIDCNVSVGSIFGIYRKADNSPGTVADVLQPGTSLVASGYCMYGSSTQMVLTYGAGVNGYTLDPSIGEFVLTHPNIRIPEVSKTIYSANEGNSVYWSQGVKNYVEKVKNAEKPWSARYVGSMVADVHRTLLYGGIFIYPADKKSPNGKLRLLYEGNPMAMIIEQAGGKAETGKGRILEVVPKDVHERQPTFIGTASFVDDLLEELRKADE